MQVDQVFQKGIYLGAFKAYHEKYDIDYNDIKKTSVHINIIKNMKDIDLTLYDYIIATPPCNYYSRCNYRRESSKYAQETKDLLPYCLKECSKIGKPFIIENVRCYERYKKEGIIKICEDNGILIYELGRHTYFTNVFINLCNIPQRQDFLNGGYKIKYDDHVNTQGGYNVYNVIEWWLKCINAKKKRGF